MPNRFVYILGAVVTLTVLCLAASVAITLFGPSQPTPNSQQLLTTLLSMTGGGFFAVLGLLTTYTPNERKNPRSQAATTRRETPGDSG